MKETSKALERRMREDPEKWKAIFKGKGVDIGSGDNLLDVPGCEPFDKEHGDANRILDFLKARTYDYVHCSHVLEHVFDPSQCVEDWLDLLKPGGYLVGEVPSWELYEGKRPTSVFNPDHKTTFSMWNKVGGSVLPHFHAPYFFSTFSDSATIHSVRLIDTNYDYCVGASVDQTFDFEKRVECFIEFVLQKV